MLALIHDNTIISTIHAGGWFGLPDGSRASPAQDGWTNGTYRLAAILPADAVPEGKQVISTSVELIDGQPHYVNVLEDAEPEQLPPLTARQLRLGLVAAGILPSQVDTAIAAIPDTNDRAVAEIEWEYASQFERDHPLIEQVGTALGLTSEQIDTMWQAAMASKQGLIISLSMTYEFRSYS